MKATFFEGTWGLEDLAIIRVSGEDAETFLHGQLTNAVKGLAPDEARMAGYCDARGRLLANGVVWRSEATTFCFLVSADLAQALARRLRMFVLRATVQLTVDDGPPVQGASGRQHVPESLWNQTAGFVHHDAGARWIVTPWSASADRPMAWRVPEDAASPRVEADPSGAGAAAWHAMRLAGGWPRIRAASQGLFLTGALNMDLNGSIDFRKGCYPGQEIIARVHYRGAVKRRLAFGATAWAEPTGPVPGTELYPANGGTPARPAGRVIESTVCDGLLHVAAETALFADTAEASEPGAVLVGESGPTLALQPVRA